jgi:hypothetical protein
MEDRMYGTHGIRKSDGEGMHAQTSYDFKRTQVLFREFLGRTGGMEVLCFDEDLISDLQIRSRFTFGIRRSLISFLSVSHFFSEELMELIKVYSKFSCVGG